MKILHVNTNNAGGGVEQYLKQLFSELTRKGHSNTFLFGQKYPNQSMGDNVQNFYIEAITHYKCKGQKNKLTEINKIINQLDPDIIYIHQVFNPGLIDVLTSIKPSIRFIHDYKLICPEGEKKLNSKKKNCLYPLGYSCQVRAYRYRCMPRNIFSGLPVIKKSKKIIRLHKKRSYIVVASEFMKSVLLYNEFDEKKIKVIPYFTYLPVLDNTKCMPENKTILAVGRLNKTKGFHHLLRAFQGVTGDAKLAIIGDGPETLYLKKLCESLLLTNRVTFYGWLPHDKLDLFFRTASIVILPSVWPEPFGIAGIEAMAYQKPVIASNAGGIPEWCSNIESGFLVEPGNEEELTKKINLLLSNPELSIQMGINGRDIAKKKYCPDTHVNILVSFIEKIITNPI